MESKGIFFYIWGKPEYGMMAFQHAMSIKKYSPLIPIHLLTDQSAVSRLRHLDFFDTVEYQQTPTDPAQAKIDMYDKLPFDHTIFLDADGLCVSEMDSVFDSMIADEKPFRCFVHAYYNQHDAPVMPLMVWANRDVIWDHYGFTDETLPATQSSFLYIRKGEFCKELYRKMQANYYNRIPIEKLRNKWGGGQPDELYLNVTLAQLGYDPACKNIIYFADDKTLRPRQIKDSHKILSLFGTAGNVSINFERFYDEEVEQMSRQMNGGVVYRWKNIKYSKHANNRVMHNKRSAFGGRFVRSEKLPVIEKKGRTLLFTSYFDAGNAQRNRELNECYKNNITNPNIDHIYVHSEKILGLQSAKSTVRQGDRPTYQTLIDWANSVSTPDDIVIIANSDIYFDQTILFPHSLPMQSTMIALSRWDVYPQGHKKLFAYEHSQDTWIFRGNISITGCDYFMGLPGCDNRFAFDANKQGYRVVNTAKDIITYHLHNSNHRSYTQADRLEGGYLPVFITSVRDLKPNKLLIHQPGKVGDIIRCAPIAKHYSDAGYSVEWECPKQYHSLFNYLPYAKAVESRTGDYGKVIDISFGLNSKSPTNITWNKRRKDGSLDSFLTLKYEIAGVPVTEVSNLTYTRNITNENNLYSHVVDAYGSDYILVHDSSDYGSPITVDTQLPIVFFEKMDGIEIFDWRKVIENAKEIHCIDSSLANFVDCVDTSAELYYYKTDRVPLKADETILTKQWKRINKLQHVERV